MQMDASRLVCLQRALFMRVSDLSLMTFEVRTDQYEEKEAVLRYWSTLDCHHITCQHDYRTEFAV
ncbi:hypothetical protein FB009_12047 [Sinorhizobium medicae]|nr:hypothetical protein FB009_12047 [Sinorhizobium medicae]